MVCVVCVVFVLCLLYLCVLCCDVGCDVVWYVLSCFFCFLYDVCVCCCGGLACLCDLCVGY